MGLDTLSMIHHRLEQRTKRIWTIHKAIALDQLPEPPILIVQTCLVRQSFSGVVIAAFVSRGLPLATVLDSKFLARTCRQPIIHAQHQEFPGVV